MYIYICTYVSVDYVGHYLGYFGGRVLVVACPCNRVGNGK